MLIRVQNKIPQQCALFVSRYVSRWNVCYFCLWLSEISVRTSYYSKCDCRCLKMVSLFLVVSIVFGQCIVLCCTDLVARRVFVAPFTTNIDWFICTIRNLRSLWLLSSSSLLSPTDQWCPHRPLPIYTTFALAPSLFYGSFILIYKHGR